MIALALKGRVAAAEESGSVEHSGTQASPLRLTLFLSLSHVPHIQREEEHAQHRG